MATDRPNEIYFGGPDLPPGRLRDVLAERVAAVPPGGTIHWVTYYFRDRLLAGELLRAHRRGVKVTLTLDRRPRTAHANQAVIAMLAGPDGLGEGFRTVCLPKAPTLLGGRRPHLHEKLYCFSHPRPVAFIGSFNPSGDGREDDPEIIREIGDQDRGHNVLVGLSDPVIVDGFVAHARWIHRTPYSLLNRFSLKINRALKNENLEIHFWPRLLPHLIIRFFRRVGKGARIRIAASHLKGKFLVKSLINLSHRGAKLEIMAESTLRRVPAATEKMLVDAGIKFHRVAHAEGFPMHNKFALIEKDGRQWTIFGSFNWTSRSYWLNHEIGVISTDRELFKTFAERWEVLEKQK